jgi:hypothetical protein
LRWLPEPTIATAGCHHRAAARIRLAAGARLVWRDELVRALSWARRLQVHDTRPGQLVEQFRAVAEALA